MQEKSIGVNETGISSSEQPQRLTHGVRHDVRIMDRFWGSGFRWSPHRRQMCTLVWCWHPEPISGDPQAIIWRSVSWWSGLAGSRSDQHDLMLCSLMPVQSMAVNTDSVSMPIREMIQRWILQWHRLLHGKSRGRHGNHSASQVLGVHLIYHSVWTRLPVVNGMVGKVE